MQPLTILFLAIAALNIFLYFWCRVPENNTGFHVHTGYQPDGGKAAAVKTLNSLNGN